MTTPAQCERCDCKFCVNRNVDCSCEGCLGPVKAGKYVKCVKLIETLDQALLYIQQLHKTIGDLHT